MTGICDHRRNVPSLAVVVPCRNEAKTIARLLDGCRAQTRPPERVLIVDDRSVDDTGRVIEEWRTRHPAPPVDFITNPGRGVAAAMNAGIGAATEEIIVRLDGHCEPKPDYIERCLAALDAPGTGLVGGVWHIQPGAQTLVASAIAAVLSHPLGSGGAAYRSPSPKTEPRAVDTVPFGAFRRALWEAIGGYDETLVRNQDYDFNYRVRLSGLAVVLDPSIVSVYRARPDLTALWRQYFDYGYWKLVMLRKFPRAVRVRQLLPLALGPLLLLSIASGALGGSLVPLVIPVAYLALNAAGAAHASIRAREPRLILAAMAALLVLQTAWSLGAWKSLVARRTP